MPSASKPFPTLTRRARRGHEEVQDRKTDGPERSPLEPPPLECGGAYWVWPHPHFHTRRVGA